ncbi:PREDICTED: kinesin-like protein Klp61F [Habropoda laboriosa]|uniref:kinesin-like protein Klp61F n=1 Tax=Habropoda laboriosa TaxID=597456 RepID=UPI00083D56B5|nr:PREDICTED: kinesin-like protein Klp61F [Habropoda laboriosa]
MNDTRNAKKDKKQHIQVYVRVRPTNNAEKVGKSITVVDIQSNREIVVRERLQDKFTKKFTFDKVFGPYSKQIDVYNAVVSPLVEEVMAGYNCTVFAYGQTGTGKTFTMEGTDNDPSLHWQTDTTAGIIPRALSHLFDELRLIEVQEFSVRVTFLELYNEEVFDLLSPIDEPAKIRIYEDPIKKGSVIVHGLEEVVIHNKNEVFKILQKGSEKRQTATTLMNAYSSRSHTIFSITIHLRDNTIDGEELLKTGKLNLVDLAGSENIGRSGAVDKRAREACNINQSLLTLGRVITALVEKTPHVPYRESKLTRLLQESLGGRTRTSIIATISPAYINLEETLSTLDYAHRARNITNRPEVNQKFSKKALLQEYTEEIERLKRDLQATRERNGIYLTPLSYNKIQSLIEYQSKEIEGKINHIKALQESMHLKEQIFSELKSRNSDQKNELLNVKNDLETTVNTLMSVSSNLAISQQEKEEQKHLVEKHASTEKILLTQVQTVLEVADTATADVHKLHDKIYRKMQIGQRNNCLAQQFKNNVKERLKNIEADISAWTKNLMQFYTFIKDHIDTESVSFSQDIDKSIRIISEELVNSEHNTHQELTKKINDSHLRHQQWLENEIKYVTVITDEQYNILNNICFNITQKIQQLIDNNIAENLIALNINISKKCDNLTESTKELITSICKCSTEERDRLNNNISDIRKQISSIRHNNKSVMERRINFAKMMQDLQRCFNELQKEQEENDFTMDDALSNIDKTCEVMNNQALDVCKITIEQENHIQEKLENELQAVKQVVAEGTDKSRLLVENAIAQGKLLINQFQADLNKSCDTLMNYKNCVVRNMRKMQQKMEVDNSLILSMINDVYTKIYDEGIEHSRYLNACKMAFMNASTEMTITLESENMNAENMNSRIIVEMQAIFNRVDKFFIEDLYRDKPTGLTPARKNFQYSKKLIKTSPHERILKRFRETLEDIEHMEDESPPGIEQ